MLTGCGKSYMKEISYTEYQELLKNKETFILEVMRTDCSACISFKPKITQVANDYKIEIKYINTDHISDKEKEKLFADTGISGTPTVLFYNDGVEKTVSSRINGSVSVDKIISKFKANNFLAE
jgi:SPBc2 prophage-derived disulfide bond formation protein A